MAWEYAWSKTYYHDWKYNHDCWGYDTGFVIWARSIDRWEVYYGVWEWDEYFDCTDLAGRDVEVASEGADGYD